MHCRWVESVQPLLGAVSLLLCLALSAPAPLESQQVRGTVVDRASGEPLTGAYVTLRDSAERRRAADLTDPSGTFSIRAPGPGRYRLRVQLIGYETWTSDPVRLDAGSTATRRLAVPVRPVRLSDLAVETRRRCDLERAEGLAAGELWEEVRKTLRVAAWTERGGDVTLEIQRYRRRLDLETRRVLSGTSRRWTRTGRRAFHSPGPAELSEAGYVRKEGEGRRFYAPDAAALLSEAFLRDHCFRVDGSRRGKGRIGLAFEPVDDRDVPEIAGVLWLDAVTAELETLEYRYVNLAPGVDAPEIGGRVEFARLPSGHTVIRRWWIQTPVIERGMKPALRRSNLPGGGARVRQERRISLASYHREGGEVVAVTGPGGERRRLAEWGAVEGVLRDRLHSDVLAGARVRLTGTSYSARAAGDGRFRLGPVPPGRYTLRVDHPMVRLLKVAGRVPVEVRPDETARADFTLPKPSGLLTRLCPDTGEADDPSGHPRRRRAALVGYVRASDGTPAAGAQVMAAATAYRPVRRGAATAIRRKEREHVTRTDSAGAYRLCGLPGGWALRLRVEVGEKRGETVRVETPDRGLVRRDLAAPGEERGDIPPEGRREPGAGDESVRLLMHRHPLSAEDAPRSAGELAADTAAADRSDGPGGPEGGGGLGRPAAAVGSLEAAARRLCLSGSDDAKGALIGRLRHAGTGEPLARAALALVWNPGDTETREGDESRWKTRAKPGETNSTGEFVACGLPLDTPIEVHAMRGDRWFRPVCVVVPSRGRLRRVDLELEARKSAEALKSGTWSCPPPE